MSNNPHRIRSQRLVLRAGTPEEAFAIRDYLRREWAASLLPAMERGFNDADVPERTIRCSRVELTLRVASTEELAEVLPERIAEELAERLRELVARGVRDDDSHGRGEGLDSGRDDGRDDAVVRGSLVGEDRFGILLAYLRTGMLAWSAAHAGADLVGGLREICRREFPRLAGLLRNGSIPAGERFDVLFRLLQLLSDEDAISFIGELLDPFFGEARTEAARIAGMAGGSASVPSIRYGHLRSVAASVDRLLEGSPEASGDPGVASGADGSSEARPSASAGRGRVLWLIERLMEGDAAEVVTRFREQIPGHWREPVAQAVADGRFGGSGRLSLFRLAAGALVTSEPGDELSGAEVTGFISRMLERLDPHEIPGFLQAVLERIAREWKHDVALVLDAVARASAGAAGDERRRRRFIAHMLAASIHAAGTASLPEFGGIAERMAADDPVLASLLERLSPSAVALLRGSAGASGGGDGVSGGGAPSSPSDAPGLPVRLSASSSSVTGSTAASAAGMRPHQAESMDAWGDDSPEESSSPVVVHYAGLVLLHPFIVPFLQDRGVAEPGSRVLAESVIPRAAALLQFLATGRDEPYEFELGLCKVLLGRDLHTPLLLAGGLVGPEDAVEADALLAAVVEHWSALKNTSADAVRESFLRRPGLLRREERRWRLQVEPASFDLLLGHLPWGISIVRLPWMSEPIHVEWERQ